MNRVTIAKIRHILEKCWSYETSVCYNPEIAPISYGQCAPTAIAVCEKFGGEILKTKIYKLDGKSIRHFYNKIDGERIDFTSDQFDIQDYWVKLVYDDVPSSVKEALTEMLPGQWDTMNVSFETAWSQLENSQ